jgi:hypothetical protein
MGPSHLLMMFQPYTQPALAGGAEVISPPAISRAASPPTMQRFMVASHHIVAGECQVLEMANTSQYA